MDMAVWEEGFLKVFLINNLGLFTEYLLPGGRLNAKPRRGLEPLWPKPRKIQGDILTKGESFVMK